MTHPQPSDEWDFLPNDDEPPVRPRRYAEVDAIHVVSLVPPMRRQHTRVPDGAPTVGPRIYFEDEQPEESDETDETEDARAVVPAADDGEPDLEDLLESQHYAFGPEPGD